MQDRNVQFPQRYKLQKVVGTDDIYDLIPTPGEISSEGTFLNKANLLKDATASVFGLGSEAVPDDVFSWLGKYNQHWWSCLHGEASVGYDEVKTVAKPLSNSAERCGLTNTPNNSQQNIYYSTSVTVNQNTGAISLDNQQTFVISSNNNPDTVANMLSELIALAPIYITNLYDNPNAIYFIPYGVTLQQKVFGTWPDFTGSTATFGFSKYSDADSAFVHYRPAMNVSSNCANPVYEVTSQIYNIPAGATTYVYSLDRNAYPDSGTVDGITYTYLGIPFDNAVTASGTETGSYTGTGEFGSVQSANSLTFSFAPKCVIIQGYRTTSNAIYTMLFIRGSSVSTGVLSYTTSSTSGAVMSSCPIVIWGEDGVQWYTTVTTSGAEAQMNLTGATYYYIAIG